MWNFHSTETLDVLEITTSNAKILLPDFMNGQRVSVKSPDGTVLEEWEEAPPSTVQLPMIQSVSWLQIDPLAHFLYCKHVHAWRVYSFTTICTYPYVHVIQYVLCMCVYIYMLIIVAYDVIP